MAVHVEVGASSKHGYVRLRLGVIVQLYGALDAYDGRGAGMARQKRSKPVDTGGMARPDRTQVEDLARNKLDTIILRKDPRLGHPGEFTYRELSSLNSGRHFPSHGGNACIYLRSAYSSIEPLQPHYHLRERAQVEAMGRRVINLSNVR